MADQVFGMNVRERTEYGIVNGPFVRYIGRYVRAIRSNGYTHVGKLVHTDSEGLLLLPTVVNVSIGSVQRLTIQRNFGMETFVPIDGCAIEALFEDDRLGYPYLEQIVGEAERAAIGRNKDLKVDVSDQVKNVTVEDVKEQ